MQRPASKWLQLLSTADLRPRASSAWEPRADVYRWRRGWLVKLELAGVRPEDVRVAVKGRFVCINGMRRDWAAGETAKAYSMEIAYNRFERTLELPRELDAARIETEFRDGMLLVRLDTEFP